MVDLQYPPGWLVDGYVKSSVTDKLWKGNCLSFEGMVRVWSNRERVMADG